MTNRISELQAAYRLLQEAKAELRPIHLGPVSVLILNQFKENPGRSMRAVGQTLQLTPAMITKHVDELVTAGFATRSNRIENDDRRTVICEATPDGQVFLDRFARA